MVVNEMAKFWVCPVQVLLVAELGQPFFVALHDGGPRSRSLHLFLPGRASAPLKPSAD